MTEKALTEVAVSYQGEHLPKSVVDFTVQAHRILLTVEGRTEFSDYKEVQEIANSTPEEQLLYIEKLRGYLRNHLDNRRYAMARNNLSHLILLTTSISGTTLAELLDTVVRKNINYGASFDECVKEFGTAGAIIRLYDKGNRLRSLLSKEDLVGEGVNDTLLDIAGYSLLTYVLVNHHPEYFNQKKKAVG